MPEFRLIFERHPDPMWVFDLETLRFLEVNHTAQAKYGYSHDEFLAMTILDIRPKSHAKALRQRLAHSDRPNEAGVWTHLTKTGEVMFVDVTSEAMRFRGRDARLLCARDVTRQHQLEIRAKGDEERFHLLAQATYDVIWDWEITSDRIWWNENMQTIFGYPTDSLEPDSSSWSNRIHPDDRAAVLKSIHAVLDGNGNHWEREYRFIHADGSVRQVIDRGVVLRGNDGSAIRMLGSMLDISERREISERLTQSQKMELVGQLTGGVAHDFNNLLTVILGNAQLLAELSVEQPNRQLAEMTAAAAKRGAELTQKLLAFARRQPLEPRPLDVNKALTDIHGLIQSTLASSTELQLHLANDLWACELDPGQFETAMLHLIVNARDAMPNGGRLTIETFNASIESPLGTKNKDLPAGHYVQVAVSDTGTGMTPTVKEHLFEPFFTTKGRSKGSGLGLPMVYGFVKQSGGGIHVYSEPGVGTTVRLLFPRTEQLQAGGANQAADEREPLTGGTETILVVEDDALVRTHVISMLQSLGYQILQAENGHQALQLLRQNPGIHLLFTDMVMPGGMSGRELAEQALSLRPELPVLFTSGYTENALMQHGRLETGITLLSKPYTPQALARKVRSVLKEQAP